MKKKNNQINKKKQSPSGITLIALVITIIVIVILGGITLSMVIGNNGLFGLSKEAQFKTKMAAYKEQVDLYVAWLVTESMNADTSGINAGDTLKEIIENKILIDITEEDITYKLEDMIKNASNEEKTYIVVYKGEMYYVSSDKNKNNEKQVEWCEEINIPILKYTSPTGIVTRNGNYEYVKDVWLCTPKLDEGFLPDRTRYLEVNEDGYLEPGNWINVKPEDDWYDYTQQKWANIYVENNGIDVYYVWIPRYCFKISDTEEERTDVKFIDVDNSYKTGEEGKLIKWEELEAQGYQVPEAFSWKKSETETVELSGYWAMKYTAGDAITPSIINYDVVVVKKVMSIKNITLNKEITDANPITKYTIALNNNIIETITDDLANISQRVIEIKNYKAGTNIINVTGLNANGEVVGSMTKEYTQAIVNKPETSAFNQDTTFYVTYDENGNEHSTIPVSQDMPDMWYEYGESKWANIVTRNNGLETYYVWIPRYEFTLDDGSERSFVKFITGTSTTTTPGYQIPEAFTWKKSETETVELTGYWAMKYTAGDAAAPSFDTEMVATSSSIRTKGITGTGVKDNQVYYYYIDGQKQDKTTTASDPFEFTGLDANKTYTILVEVRDSNDAYVGSIVKQITTIDANKPQLIGFNASRTYYVLYDDNGNETIGSNIQNDGNNMPNDWYDYSKSKWANIVVTNGTIVDGKITNATVTTYYVWIPRYEFKITASQAAQPAAGRTEVRFVKDKTTDTTPGYQIPEAFTFNNQELTGYWAMKYTAGE